MLIPEWVFVLIVILAGTNLMLFVTVLLYRSDLTDQHDRVFDQWSDELLKRGHTNERLCRYLEKLLGEEEE